MRLFVKENCPPKKVLQELANVDLGGKKAGQIMGFQAAFCFFLPDLYISDGVERLLEQHPEAEALLHDLLARFKKDDYGEITFDQQEYNDEQRHCWGYFVDLVSQYPTEFGTIRLDMFDNAGLFYLLREDIHLVVHRPPFTRPQPPISAP